MDLPEFLFYTIPIKHKTNPDSRIWVYHRFSLSLVQFYMLHPERIIKFDEVKKIFVYNEETWVGMILQNNFSLSRHNEEEVLDSV